MSTRASIVSEHFDELKHQYPTLTLAQNKAGLWEITGPLGFAAEFKGTTIEEEFEISVECPHDFPDSPPTARETGQRIPRDFHLNPDGTLCLGATAEVKLKFQEHPRLLHFIEQQVIPYLYAFSHKQRYGTVPFGELRHGALGLLDFYKDQFQTPDLTATLRLLHILAAGNYRGHLPCPCGSQKRLRNCHGTQLRKLSTAQEPVHYLIEAGWIISKLSADDQKTLAMDGVLSAFLRTHKKAMKEHRRKTRRKLRRKKPRRRGSNK